MPTKTCPKCKQNKGFYEFHVDKHQPSGRASHCKACRSKVRPTLEQRFWKYTDKRGDDECWEWRGARVDVTRGSLSVVKPSLRGVISVDNKPMYAYRLSWQLFRGILPKRLFVCHTCDNGLCVNPNHLFIGSAKTNTQDMIRKGRAGWQVYTNYGRNIRKRIFKISNKDVDALIESYKKGNVTLKKLGEQYGISESMVCRIIKGNRRYARG